MTKTMRRDALSTVLLAIESTAIIAGFVATAVVLVKSYLDKHRRDEAVPAMKAKSSCDGGTGTLATLRAWLDGAELRAEPTGPEPAIDDTMRARGAALFAEHCATCHGAHGDGAGPTAKQLAHPPANFTIGTFELRTTEHEALPADVDMFRTISRGVHGTAMPPWFALPERDRWALAAHLKTLSKQFAEDQAPPPIDVSHAPAVTAERITHGRQLYDSAGCASCHGPDARGDGPAAAALHYASGGPAKPRDLRVGRFHRGSRLPEIYLTLVTGLDGTPMGSFAKVLRPDDLWDVAMYVASIAPAVTEIADGTRCPQIAEELRCFELTTGVDCPAPLVNPDELVGVRMLLHSLHPNH
jgi:mono/diheme cytochrome c family protein